MPHNKQSYKRSEEIKHKKQSYEATKVTQEHVEIKAMNNNYDSQLPHYEHKEPPKTYKKEKHAPSRGFYNKKPIEQKQELIEPGDYSASIGEKNDSPMSSEGQGSKHYHQPTSGGASPVQEHVEADFKGIIKPSSHISTQQAGYEIGLRPQHYGHEGGYKGYSNYMSYKNFMMNQQPKPITPSSPQTFGIYREGPKKYPSINHGSAADISSYQKPENKPHYSGGTSYHYSRSNGKAGLGGAISSHHSLGSIGNGYKGHGGIKSSGIKNNGASGHGISTGSHYKSNGGISGLHSLGGGSNLGHYNHKHSSIGSSTHSGHYNQPKYSGTGGQKHHSYNHGSDYSHSIGGQRSPSIKSSPGHHRQHSGSNIASSPHNHYSRPVSIPLRPKKDDYQPKSIKSSGIKYPHAGGRILGGSGSSPKQHGSNNRGIQSSSKTSRNNGAHHALKSYPEPKLQQEKHNEDYHPSGSNSGVLSTGSTKGKASRNSGIHHAAKSYPQPKLSQEKHEDDHKSSGESKGHSPSYKSPPAPSKTHYQPKHEPKPSYESSKGGYQPPKDHMEYHGIGESNADPPSAELPSPSKGHSIKGGSGRSGIKSGSSSRSPSHGEKKYLPVTSSHSQVSSNEQPLKETSKKYEPSKIEQKDIGYEGLLGGHGNQSPGSASGGYGFSSSPSDESSSSHETYGSDDKHEMSKPMPYEFKYEVKDDEHGADHYREEKMDDNGYLTGRYGYKDAHGLYRQLKRTASLIIRCNTSPPGQKSA
ncbi:cuticle protein 16.8 [Nephila pilipes]|uniref:Cuticle protein 16.8 n=1 Tax=Nephila pilipes TaxID=299642 RepID=A0A8X6NYQ7_NEPPI|nr:cuticle protein 16.8 [Nephila pilipes]